MIGRMKELERAVLELQRQNSLMLTELVAVAEADSSQFLHHEVLDRIYCAQHMLDTTLMEHAGVSTEVLVHLMAAMDSLSAAYQQAGREVA